MKPSFLIANESATARKIERYTEDGKRERDARKRKAQRYERVSFCTTYVAISDMLKWSNLKASAPTVNDYAMDMQENIDMTPCFFNSASLDDDDIENARELVRYLLPNVPASAIDDDELETDLRRAMCDASESDYCDQFSTWLIGEIERVADETGIEWAWLDEKRAPTEYAYEAAYIGFAVSRRAFLKDDAPFWTTFNCHSCYTSNRDRMDNAADIVEEHIGDECREKINLEFFDERGSRGGETDAWPEYFMEGRSSVVDELEHKEKEMRAKLRAMIAARAPLHKRAELIANAYGASS